MVIHSSGSQISKQEIRAYVLQKRRTLLPEEKQRWDEALLERLHPLFPSAGTAVYAYTSVRGEASTEYLIDELLKRGCRVALPRVFGREMRFFYVTDRSQLVAGAYGIPEPADGCQEADAPKALVITSVMGRGIMTAFLRQNRTIWRWGSAMDSSCFRHLKPKSTIKKWHIL